MRKTLLCMSLLVGSHAWAISCSTPVTLSQPGQNHTRPKAAINEDGEPMALWVSRNQENDTDTLFAATRDVEKKWTSQALSNPEDDISHYVPLIDSQGSAYAHWKAYRDDDEDDREKVYQFAKKEKNNPWSSALDNLGLDPSFKVSKVVFGPQGNLVSFGSSPDAETSDMLINYLHQPGERKLHELPKISGYRENRMILTSKGKAFAFWSFRESGFENSKYFSRKCFQGVWSQEAPTWSEPVTIYNFDDTNESMSGVKGVMNSSENIAMVWESHQYGENSYRIQSITAFDHQWSEPACLATCKNIRSLKIAMNDQGHVLAAWCTKEGKKEVVYAAEKPQGQPWSSPIALSDKAKDAEGLKIAIDSHGNILTVWTVKVGKRWVPYAAYKPAQQPWSSPAQLSDGSKQCTNIKAGVNNAGYFVVLWNEQEKLNLSIHGAALSTNTQEWSHSVLTPEGQACSDFSFVFNEKGQGAIAWETSWDFEETHIQVAELKAD